MTASRKHRFNDEWLRRASDILEHGEVSNLEISDRLRPQDGRAKLRVGRNEKAGLTFAAALRRAALSAA